MEKTWYPHDPEKNTADKNLRRRSEKKPRDPRHYLVKMLDKECNQSAENRADGSGESRKFEIMAAIFDLILFRLQFLISFCGLLLGAILALALK